MFEPSLIQILLTLIALFAVERLVARLRVRRMGILFAACWLCGIAVFLLFVWRPDFATRVSNFIGVGRGVDAALYISVALLFYIVLRLLIRLERQEDIITQLVSEIALLEKKDEL